MSQSTLFLANTSHLEQDAEAGDVIAIDLLDEALAIQFPAYEVSHADCDAMEGYAMIWIKAIVDNAPVPLKLDGWGTLGEYGITLRLAS